MDISEKYSHIRQELSSIFENKPKFLLLGIGENRMGDDGAGQYISFYLDEYNKYSKIAIINGGITPEERLDEIIQFQPEFMLILDVIDLPAPAGTVDLFEESRMQNYLPISSHSMPLPVFVDRCRQYIPEIQMKLLGIKPYSLEFLDHYSLFKEDIYDLDEKEANPNIPFYDFNLTKEMREICDNLVKIFAELFQKYYEIDNFEKR
ncbi:hydrogenase maturation protease [Candidatus Harpocratesius sp.]